MKKVIILKGLPASGKSTYAKQLIFNNPGVYKRVNKDDLRSMLDDGKWSKHNEQFVLKLRDKIIIDSLQEGKHVIVDDTNLHPKHEQNIRDLVKEMEVKIDVITFDTPIEECIERDLKRTKSVGEKVIRDMYKQFIRKPNIIEYDIDLNDCYIFDIDGTLAIKGERSPYDWERVGEDIVNKEVIHIWNVLKKSVNEEGRQTKFFIVSGRDSICRPKTENWLSNNGIFPDALYMRKQGDNRKDSIVKEEIYNEYIKGRFNVRIIFDDRNQVVEMWRNLGLKVFQVDEGDF